MSLSKLAEDCKKCLYVSTCNHKRMEAVGALPLKENAAESAADSAVSAAMPVMRETVTVMRNGE